MYYVYMYEDNKLVYELLQWRGKSARSRQEDRRPTWEDSRKTTTTVCVFPPTTGALFFFFFIIIIRWPSAPIVAKETVAIPGRDGLPGRLPAVQTAVSAPTMRIESTTGPVCCAAATGGRDRCPATDLRPTTALQPSGKRGGKQ